MLRVNRRRAVAHASVAALAALTSLKAMSNSYPARTIRFVVAYPPGGSADLIARSLAQRLADVLGQPVIVENKVGASGAIGTDYVAKSPPDGYTLLITSHLLVQSHTLQPKLAYDPLRDLAPVTDLLRTPVWLAVRQAPDMPISLPDLLRIGKSRAIAVGISGYGSAGHLYGTRLGQLHDLKLTSVPYKGAAQVAMGLATGEIDAAFIDYSTVKSFVAAGKVRILAVADARRSRSTPDVPTFGEQGLSGFDARGWIGMFAPAKTPADIVDRVASEVTRIMKEPAFAAKFEEQGFEMGGISPVGFAAQLASEFELWAGLVKSAGLKAQ